MAQKTTSFIRKIYKGLLLAALGITAFILKMQNDPQAQPFEPAHAEFIPYDGSPDCPGPGPGDCGGA